MKMKVVVFLSLALLLVAMVLIDKHVGGLGMMNEDIHSKKPRPAPISEPALLKPDLPTGQGSIAETPEMKNAKIMAQLRSEKEKIKHLMDAPKEGGISAAIMEKDKAEWLLYLNTLGYSAEASQQVFQMFKKLIAVHASMGEAKILDQVRADFIAKVGMENYHKIQHQFATQTERHLINEYQTGLSNQSKPLTDTQRVAIVEAMFQSAKGKPSPLQSRSDSTNDKIAYIDRVKDSLKLVLNPHEIESLGNYLTKIAEKTSKPLPFLPQLPPGIPETEELRNKINELNKQIQVLQK